MNRKLNAADKALDAHMDAEALNKEAIKAFAYGLRMLKAREEQDKVTAEYIDMASQYLVREGVGT